MIGNDNLPDRIVAGLAIVFAIALVLAGLWAFL